MSPGVKSAFGAAMGFFYADPAQSLAKWTRVIATNGFIFLAVHLLLRIAARLIPRGDKRNLAL
jgi:hypothetical protein